jgi:hypothetical protein
MLAKAGGPLACPDLPWPGSERLVARDATRRHLGGFPRRDLEGVMEHMIHAYQPILTTNSAKRPKSCWFCTFKCLLVAY